MNYWLLKTEPDSYSITDLRKDGTTSWGGIRNYQARNYLRDDMEKGDLCLFYHSSAKPMAVMGICEVVKEAYPDETQFDPSDDHFDIDSEMDKPRWYAVDVAFRKIFHSPVLLSQMKNNSKLADMKLLNRGTRLSVLPVTKKEFEEIVRLGSC